MIRSPGIFILISLLIVTVLIGSDESLKIGSKKFTENVILGEIATQIAIEAGYDASHLAELGGTRILWNSLLSGEIDIYPDYTGTIRVEILQNPTLLDFQSLVKALSNYDIAMSPSLGFSNTYALGMQTPLARELKIATISDLANHTDLLFGFTNEFLDRADGWHGLQQEYRLDNEVRGLDHDLAYRGLAAGSIQVIDMYSTDAEIDYYSLTTLIDDRAYFPRYKAVYLYRQDLVERAPEFVSQLNRLGGQIDESAMIGMNVRAKLNQEPVNQVAADFINETLGLDIETVQISIWDRLLKNTRDHLTLVVISLSGAILLAIPLGIIASKCSRIGKIILGTVGIIQTIPSLALLVFMIPMLGIGGPPAIVALFLYSLLPIVRNTYTGIDGIDTPIRESALALGLSATARLWQIELPLASRLILAGVKTSAVINVGTATLGALIGAGGYGQPILTGIRLDDMSLILQGAVPAACLALLVQGFFDLSEFIFVPRGLRLSAIKSMKVKYNG